MPPYYPNLLAFRTGASTLFQNFCGMYELLESWVTPLLDQSLTLYIFILTASILAGFYTLIKGGDWLSDHSSNLACQLGVPPVIVGLTIVSIATSTPELFTSISALKSESPGLILGNIIGSNIANVGLILGIALLLGQVSTHNAVSIGQRYCLLLVTVSFCLVLFCTNNNEFGFYPGIIFLGFILGYLIVLSFHGLKENKAKKNIQNFEITENSVSSGILFSLVMLLIATLSLWIGADSLVFGSKSLAQLGGVPEELIGFTLLAIGTSLPELAASISLVRKKETGMLLGNIVGSNLFNIALIGGLAGVMGPVQGSSPHAWIDYLFLLLTTGILLYWLKGKLMSKKEGIILLMIYLIASASTWILNS